MVLLHFVCVTDHGCLEVSVHDQGHWTPYEEHYDLYETSHISQKLKHALHRSYIDIPHRVDPQVHRKQHQVLFVKLLIAIVHFALFKYCLSLCREQELHGMVISINVAYLIELVDTLACLRCESIVQRCVHPVLDHITWFRLSEVDQGPHLEECNIW